MHIKLERYSYSDTETEGVLRIVSGGREHRFATIERPWIPNPNGARGGKPGTPGRPDLPASCVPDGAYSLLPWTRPNGERVYILYAPELGVHRVPNQHEEGRGRNLILIHIGNWVDDVIGCIAPGLVRNPMPRRGKMQQAVASSSAAMAEIRWLLGDGPTHTLLITNETGASDVTV